MLKIQERILEDKSEFLRILEICLDDARYVRPLDTHSRVTSEFAHTRLPVDTRGSYDPYKKRHSGRAAVSS